MSVIVAARARPVGRTALLTLLLGLALAGGLLTVGSTTPASAATRWYTSAPAQAKAYPVLHYGSRGVAVSYVQKRMLMKPTGYYGLATIRVVRGWERRNGMAADGRITTGNWRAMHVPHQRVAAARISVHSGHSSAVRSSGSWVRPLRSLHVNSPFGVRRSSHRHTGTDFRAASGTPVYAAAAGRVSSGRAGGYGNRVVIRHAGGTQTWYAHLSRYVKRSGYVRAGQLIARSGSTGNSTGPHLHFEVHPGGHSAVDPVTWLRRHGVRV